MTSPERRASSRNLHTVEQRNISQFPHPSEKRKPRLTNAQKAELALENKIRRNISSPGFEGPFWDQAYRDYYGNERIDEIMGIKFSR